MLHLILIKAIGKKENKYNCKENTENISVPQLKVWDITEKGKSPSSDTMAEKYGNSGDFPDKKPAFLPAGR